MATSTAAHRGLSPSANRRLVDGRCHHRRREQRNGGAGRHGHAGRDLPARRSLALNGTSLVIHGFGFDTTAAHNTVVFNDGAVGDRHRRDPDALTVTFSTKPTATGTLTAVVTTDSQISGTAVQVATVVSRRNGADRDQQHSQPGRQRNQLYHRRHGLQHDARQQRRDLQQRRDGHRHRGDRYAAHRGADDGAYRRAALPPAVSTLGVSSGTAVQVATVVPVVTSSTASLAINATTITINGYGFDPTAAHNTVTFNNGAVGHHHRGDRDIAHRDIRHQADMPSAA